MKKIIEDFLNKKNIIAVVGVSRDPEKYGFRVYQDLKKSGYRVYPINPNVSSILQDKCYPDLNHLPVKPDVVNLVVPPKITEEVVKKCRNLNITKVWMQPGSESKDAINFCINNGIDVVYGSCIMIESKKMRAPE